MFDLKKLGQTHAIQFLQWHNLMVNVNIYKCLQYIFAQALTVSEI